MKRLILIVSLLGLIFFSACGKSDDTEQEEPIDNDPTEAGLEEEEQEAGDQTSSDSKQEEAEESTDDSSTKPSDESKDNDKSTEKDNEGKDPEAETIKTGSFNGQADPHTIEIETDEGPVAYQLTLEARDLVIDLESGDKVTYTYYKDGEMLVIKHIEKID